MLIRIALFLFCISLLQAGCNRSASDVPDECGSDNATGLSNLRIVTTTSLYDSGLWDVLEPLFEAEYGIETDVIYAGTGRALEIARLGEADVLTVHSESRETEFISDGFGVTRIPFAYNYFVIAGPASDLAGISGETPEQAFRLIAESGMPFISRGDDSGTHSREKDIWESAGLDYQEVCNSREWYIMGGSGMGATLVMADELGAYTLSDIGTFLTYQDRLELLALVNSGAGLLNVYSVIEVTSTANYKEAELFIEFLTSTDTQELIGNYGIAEYGRTLFFPCFNAEVR